MFAGAATVGIVDRWRPAGGVPTAGDFLSDATQGRIDGQHYDTDREMRPTRCGERPAGP